MVVLNCSPRMDKSDTNLILNPFVLGMKKANAEIDILYIKKLNINPCHGELNCFMKTPGRCYLKDDMYILYETILLADIIVFSTPVHSHGVSSYLSKVLERGLPLLTPYIEEREGHSYHTNRNKRDGKIVLVSSCAFWELDNFDPLLMRIKSFCKGSLKEYAGALLRPHMPALRIMEKSSNLVIDIFNAAEEAGKQLIVNGEIEKDMLRTISRELMPLKKYIKINNFYFRNILKKNAK
ncbi:flavodoxin family protein [Chlamydiota bacterium]